VPRVFSQIVKERQKVFSRTVSEADFGLSPENYFVLLVPVPNFLRKGTPSLAAFPKSVKRLSGVDPEKLKPSAQEPEIFDL
jgi:hypothetical protein